MATVLELIDAEIKAFHSNATATEIVAWWTSMPIYFSWLITALLSVSGDANNHNLP